MSDYLHNHIEFKKVLRAVEREQNINISLVEKDYWIMHVLYGLQKCGFKFELKGGTSLSKGYRIIHRFSEDIDIRIEPPSTMNVKVGKNHLKPSHCESRKIYYDWLARNIKINGIIKVERDNQFDNDKYFSGGIRLFYKSSQVFVEGLKEGVLLEAGFDSVKPNIPLTISSWALDFAQKNNMNVINNKANNVKCYHPGFTFVEKLQTIATKFRYYKETRKIPANFIRHYYDVACLLDNDIVKSFIGTKEYLIHKKKRFPIKDQVISLSKQEAFLLNNCEIRNNFEKEYKKTRALYYKEEFSLNDILGKILENLDSL